jgi:hypothetical protein
MPPRAEIGAKVDFSRTGIARHIQLASLFRRRIESGLWVPGQQIPTVDDLAAECGLPAPPFAGASGISRRAPDHATAPRAPCVLGGLAT